MSWIITSFHCFGLDARLPEGTNRSWWPQATSLGTPTYLLPWTQGLQLRSGHGAPSSPAPPQTLTAGTSSPASDPFWMDLSPHCWMVQLQLCFQPHLLLLPAGAWLDPGPGSALSVSGMSLAPVTCPQLCPPGSYPSGRYPTSL